MKDATRRSSDQATSGPRVLPSAKAIWAAAVATVTVAGGLDSSGPPGWPASSGRSRHPTPQKLVLDPHGSVFVNLPGARSMVTLREAVQAGARWCYAPALTLLTDTPLPRCQVR